MAPKLLTDCPENLREAIDWLVQVQHCGGVSTVSGALSTLFDNVAQDAEKSLPSLPDPDRPSARGVVSKLRAFQSTLPKNSENPNKNIIHNLCSSAASLLGYRSPGTYDGSGIVYGNASRLCDAILAFLYAVFSDVRDNQSYVAGRDVLHDVIVELKAQLWRGHKGFCQVIPKVANGLRSYNAAVKASNDRVKEPVETVLEYVKPGGELRSGIHNLQITETSTSTQDERTVESAVSLVEGCKEVARTFSKSLTAATNAIDDLNPKLKRKLENARRSFFNHVEWLSKWSTKGQKKRLEQMVQKIKSRLKQLVKAVKDKIKQEVHTVVELLKKRVREIRMKLEGITDSLEEYVKELGTWMDDAKKYINDVKEYVDDIMKQLDGKHRKAIDKAAADIDSEFGKKVEELNKWISEAEAAVNVAKDKAAYVYERLNKDDKDQKISQGIDKITTANEKVRQVDTQLELVHKDLEDWKTAAQGVLKNAAAKADEVSRQLHPDHDGEGHLIAQNIKSIDGANQHFAKANKELGGQAKGLKILIQDAESIRAAAHKKAEDAYENLDVHDELSQNVQKIVDARKKISDARRGLKNVASQLREWDTEAKGVLGLAIGKATDVFKRLDEGDADNDISKGITQITRAAAEVSNVDWKLQKTHSDLGKWINAADIMLTTAVQKAEEVNTELDPQNSDTIGKNIGAIIDAKTALIGANETLKNEVASLNKWIENAEEIRFKAEQKAKEAYSRLKVHEQLSENVKKIVQAKDTIGGVHGELDKVQGNLLEWSEQVREVIQEAMNNAQGVHDKLKENNDGVNSKLGNELQNLDAAKERIKSSNNELRQHVENLGKWNVAAREFIKRADDKCDEILMKVDKHHENNKDKDKRAIFTEAGKLQKKGSKLLKAAKEAREQVEQKVNDALVAVKAMDTDLRKDLKGVKDNLKMEIRNIIQKLQVDRLGEKVEEDLKALRQRISDLSKGLAKDGKYNPIVEKALHDLEQANRRITVETNKIKTETEQKLVEKFNSDIQKPLAEKVTAVERAIGELYKTVNPTDGVLEEDKKKLQPIFEHIKRQVADIKGSGKKENESGIDGIVAHVRRLYDAFVDGNNSGVGARVHGWTESILGINKKKDKAMEAVTSWIKDYDGIVGNGETDFRGNVKKQIVIALSSQIKAGQANIKQQDVSNEIVQNLTKVKAACDKFVEDLDKQLTNTQIDNFVQNIVRGIQGSPGAGGSGVNDKDLTAAVKAALIALCSCVRQVALEVQFIGINMFGKKIDAIKPTVDGLDGKLKKATNAVTPGKATLETGTAQAVDTAISGVKDMVDNTIKEKFQQDVKKPVENAVKRLDAAVKAFDNAAKQQTRKAAEKAIEEAGNQFGRNSKIELGRNGIMHQFKEAYDSIKSGLPKNVRDLVEKYIGRDELEYIGQLEKVRLSEYFKKYREHVSVGVLTEHVYGSLAEAIERIGAEGMNALNKHIGKDAKDIDKVTQATFGESIETIKKELEHITKLVSDRRSSLLGGFGPNRASLKGLLSELKNGLEYGKYPWIADVDGLERIIQAIGDLQKGAFEEQRSNIEEVTKAIRHQLEVLKKELLNGDKNDVIKRLEELKEIGFAKGDWKDKLSDGKKISGLGIIQAELQKQNEKLPEEAKNIGEAIYKIKELMQTVLREVGMKLDDTLLDDDIMDILGAMKLMIGLGGHGGLQGIHHVIKKLREEHFKVKPTAIQKAVASIKIELKRLLHVLDNKEGNDVIKTLKDLRDIGLSDNLWKRHGNEKGLEAIEQEINKQHDILHEQPEQIDAGVEQITKELESLRNALISRSGDPKDDVVHTLKAMKNQGLGKETWNNKDGSPVHGLGKIRSELQEQNNKLSADGEDMEKAMDTVLMQIQGVLRNARMKLGHHIIPHDDIAWDLHQLQRIFGLGKIKDHNNLQNIRNEIEELQSKIFTEKHEAIGKAKEHIANELRRLKHELDSNVSSALMELIGNGLGKDKTWQNNNKGLGFINGEIERQQGILKKQPEDIEAGVLVVTNELDELRNVLDGRDSSTAQERGVMGNLEFLMKDIGDSDDVGLKKVRKALETLNTKTVPVVTDNLGKLCGDIQEYGAYAHWHVSQMQTSHIDKKLKGIETGLKNLRLIDLVEAITMCDEFLDKADEIERNTIDALLKHVDYEVDDAIKDLTKEARALYVDSVKDALEMFARKVEGDLEQLPNEINRDRYMGYKGFMRYLQGPLTSDLTGDEQSVAELSSAFQEVFQQIEKYVKGEITRLHDEQNKEKNLSLPPTGEPYTPKLNDVYDALTSLLAYLKDNNDGADKLTELVERLTITLSDLVPSDFKHPSTPLLDTIARGLSKFAGEFGNTYISAYSGQRCKEEHAHKYAKVLLSMIPMTHQALTKLATKCESEWKSLHICEFTSDHKDNALGNYLTRCGYRVSTSESEQDGELNNMFTGAGIHELLTTPIEDVSIEMMIDGESLKNGMNLVTIISLLYNVLCQYLQVCHIYVPPNPRYPCTVRDMLSWLSGLQYTMVADKLPDHCKALLNRRCHDGGICNRDDSVMAKCIGELPYTIAATCSYSTALLTAIQGNGHGFDLAAYPYSVDFSNNRAKLHYPNDPGELLDMLYQIVCRLCRVLYFLYSQCCRSTARVKGWRECTYGRQVQSHNWQCNTLDRGSTNSATTTTAATTTSSTPTHGCPPTSPLQSFLSDSCHGLLPHTLTAADGTIECANCTANQPGQQCLTPLGFWDLGFAASIGGTGWDLAKRLGDMCRDADSCLFVLCRTLSLLCPTAPSSLADVFALYAQVLRQWDTHDRVNHRGGTYTDASDFISHLNADGIDSLFPLWTVLHGSYENHKLTRAIASLAGHDHESHNGLSTLFNDSTCKPPSGCAPYLQPLGLHANHTYPQKHAGLYITWMMYLAWQFWELLSDLLQALDNIDCTASGCATCPCQPGIHGDKDTCHCPSIVQCAGPLPTLYRCGFTFRNANLLVTANRTMRCGDLNAQLKEALHSDHFTELFRQIDQLIWHIRMPFLYCLVALWTITALYILHTFFYRMDILRIRSHLIRTKASHLIDVKALLSDNKKMMSLYDANYFDDDPNELLNLRY